MKPPMVLVGLFLTLSGTVVFTHPHDVRNFVSSHEWQRNPERARRKQELYAKIVGAFLAG